MSQKNVGHIVDTDGTEIEVWVQTVPGQSNQYDHVFIMYGGSQIEDFPFNQPCQNNQLQLTAQRVAEGEAKRLTVFSEDDMVIDYDDCQSPPFKTLRRWSGDGKVH